MIEKHLTYYVAKQDISIKPGLQSLFYAEGDSEVLFLEKTLEVLRADPTRNATVCFAGLANLTAKVQLPAKHKNFSQIQSFGMMLDAEGDLAARQQSIQAAAKSLGFPNLPPSGQVQQGTKKFGAFISPGKNKGGAIEDLILGEISTKPIWSCIADFVKCSRNLGLPLNSKSITQIYISVMASTTAPRLCGVGRAFEAGILDPAANCYQDVRQLVQQLIS